MDREPVSILFCRSWKEEKDKCKAMKMDQKNILIIDDEQDLLELLEKRFAACGYNVMTAQNGRDGLELAYAEMPDLIILDVVMPEITGGSVGLTLHEDPRTSHIPVVYLSCTFADKKTDSPRFGDCITMAKPYDTEELLKTVEKLCSQNTTMA